MSKLIPIDNRVICIYHLNKSVNWMAEGAKAFMIDSDFWKRVIMWNAMNRGLESGRYLNRGDEKLSVS